MKTLYLHIGTPKTATTAIRDFLDANRDALSVLSVSSLVPARLPGAAGYLSTSTRVLETTRDAVLGAFESHDVAVASDETLWVHAASGDESLWEGWAAHAREHAYALKIIVYLRRQDSCAASLYAQDVKASACTQDFRAWLSGHRSVMLDYASGLEVISRHVPADDVIVRVFERRAFEGPGGTIVSDFLDCLGIELDDRFAIPPRFGNTSLSLNLCALKRLANQSLGGYESRDPFFRRAAIVCSRISPPTSGAKAAALFSGDEAARFLACFDEGNAAVARDYLHSDAPLFAEPVAAASAWTPDNPEMPADAVRFFCCVNALQNEHIAGRDGDGPGTRAGESSEVLVAATPDPRDYRDIPWADIESAARRLSDFFAWRGRRIVAGRTVEFMDAVSCALCVRTLLGLRLPEASSVADEGGTFDAVDGSDAATLVRLPFAARLSQRLRSLSVPLRHFFVLVRKSLCEPTRALRYVKRVLAKR